VGLDSKNTGIPVVKKLILLKITPMKIALGKKDEW
jgi:hypothetical protein